MNFYASPGYLGVLADVFFEGHRSRVVDTRIDGEVLRLLEVDRKRVITDALFLDYHEPLRDEEIRAPAREHDFAERVARAVVEVAPDAVDHATASPLAPFVDWSRFPTFDDYRSFLVSRKRRLVRERERRGRRLADDLGEPVFRMDDPRDDVLALAREWKSRQLRATGLRDIFADPKATAYFEVLRERGLLTSSTLRAGDRLLAAWLGFVHDGCWSGWIFTYDPELARYSPGHQLLSAMLEESHRRGHEAFDFSTGAEDYKLLYATHARVLGPLGSPPLGRRIVASAKKQARRHAPELVSHARAVKRAIAAPPVASTAGSAAPPPSYDTAPPDEDQPRPSTALRRAKASAVKRISALCLPVLQRVARDHVGGETIDDALAVAHKLSREGASSTLGFWESAELVGRPVVDTYLAGVERLAATELDSTLSIKPPAMQFDPRWGAELGAAAARRRVRIHCDSHGPEVADATHALEQALLEQLPCTSVSTTLPGRWSRSLADAERAIELGLGVRVVKGQWPDPADPKRDLRAGYLEVIDRLAGRARHVGVATHDVALAAEAIARLHAAGTPCELELLFGRPMAAPLRWARDSGVRVRTYVPFGKGFIPSAIGILRRNPQLAFRMLNSLVAEMLGLVPQSERGDQTAAPLEDSDSASLRRPAPLDRKHLQVPPTKPRQPKGQSSPLTPFSLSPSASPSVPMPPPPPVDA